MKTEYEVKILDIDVEKIEEKLKEIKAKKISEKNQRRYVYDFTPKKKNSWVRLRDTGEKITLTIKEIHNDNIDGTKELEIKVDHFDETNLILEKLGYRAKAYQENKRVSYRFEDVKIEIDSWPKIPTYLEIEAESAQEVERVVKLLGFELKDTTSINTTDVYKKYGINLEEIKNLSFHQVK